MVAGPIVTTGSVGGTGVGYGVIVGQGVDVGSGAAWGAGQTGIAVSAAPATRATRDRERRLTLASST